MALANAAASASSLKPVTDKTGPNTSFWKTPEPGPIRRGSWGVVIAAAILVDHLTAGHHVGAFGTCGIDMAGNPCQLFGVVDGTRLRVDQKRIACPETRQPVLQQVKERFLCGVFDNQA